MRLDHVADKYIDKFKRSQAQASLLNIEIGKKGKGSTRLVKQIVLTRLDGLDCKPQHFKGETYTCALNGEMTKFSFRVTASARDSAGNIWWTNFTIEELKNLRDGYE